MTVGLSPVFNPDGAQIDASSVPRSGAKLFTYLATGGSPKVTTYRDSAGTVAHRNPILLDSNGLPPAPIWLTQGSTYKFVLAPSTDSDPPVSALLTIDNITSINDVASVVAAEWTASGMTPTYISATSFSVTGDQTSTLDVGRRLKLTESGSTLYGTIIKSTYTSLTTVTVRLDSGSLTSDFTGNDFWYGIVSAANTSLPYLSRDQQCGRLGYVSTTSIRLDPQDGATIWIYTAAAGWTRRIIPSAGVTAANTSTYVNGTAGQSLAASTTYYVYLFDNAGVLTVDFSTSAPAVDATSGLKIKTGDATRLLVGMVRTDGSTPGLFQTPGLVLSWYKRLPIAIEGPALSSNPTTTSASAVELQVGARMLFLAWGEDDISAHFNGCGRHSSNAQTFTTKVTLDGTSTAFCAPNVVRPAVAAYKCNVSCGGTKIATTDGYHYATITVLTSAATATYDSGGALCGIIRG
jgi:hypothetical protein